MAWALIFALPLCSWCSWWFFLFSATTRRTSVVFGENSRIIAFSGVGCRSRGHFTHGGAAMLKFLGRFKSEVVGVLSGLDRIRFRGTKRFVSTVRGMTEYLWKRRILLKDFSNFAQATTATHRRRPGAGRTLGLSHRLSQQQLTFQGGFRSFAGQSTRHLTRAGGHSKLCGTMPVLYGATRRSISEAPIMLYAHEVPILLPLLP